MKTFHITVNESSYEELVQVVSKRLSDRGMSYREEADLRVTVTVDPSFKEDSFRITGKTHNIEIVADSLINAYAGCGRLLYTGSFTEDGFMPSDIRGSVSYDCEIRCVYTATHFHTFYFNAPLESVYTYLEDLALMGINGIAHPVPDINLNINRREELEAAFDRCAAVCKKAMSLGMKIHFGGTTSCTFLDIPEHLKAVPIPDPIPCRGNSGHKVCPSKPDGQKILDEQNRFVMNQWKMRGINVDYVGFFPYDEGGCGCEMCHPWGARGYIKACKRAKEVIREIYPDCKFIVGTWLFDRPEEGEWEALSKSLDEEKWADVIMADSHDAFPRYPLDVKVPGNLPLIAFPEISMWGLWPWGGYGASFFPKRYTGIWRSTEGKLHGGRMYSEGIYEDLNKYIVAGLYRDYNNDPDRAVAEYARYHFGCRDTEKFVEMVDCIEKNMVLNADNSGGKVFMTPEMNKSDPALAERARELALELDAQLPTWGRKSWRWRTMYIRTVLDLHRYRNEKLHENEEAVAAMQELAEIYCCIKDYKIADDPYHLKLRPPFPVYDENFDPADYQNIGSILNAAAIGLIVNEKNVDIRVTSGGNQA